MTFHLAKRYLRNNQWHIAHDPPTKITVKGESDMKKEERRLSLAAGLVVSSLAVTAPAFAEGEVVFSSWGGRFRMPYAQQC